MENLNKILAAVVLGFVFISFAYAFPICIDNTPPSAPSNLTLSSSGLTISLSWVAATDSPSCSGVESYSISRSFNGGNATFLKTVTGTSLSESVSAYGNYTYLVSAVDKAGNEGQSRVNSIVVSAGAPVPGPSGGGGGGTSGTPSTYTCGNWSLCVNGLESRVCVSSGLNNITETRPCVLQLSEPLNGTNSSLGGSSSGSNSSSSSANFLSTTGNAIAGFTGGAVSDIGGFVSSTLGATILGLLLLGVLIFFSVRRNRDSGN